MNEFVNIGPQLPPWYYTVAKDAGRLRRRIARLDLTDWDVRYAKRILWEVSRLSLSTLQAVDVSLHVVESIITLTERRLLPRK